ncbi:hypothetical protein DOY81_013710 [Sarcophaga bullata]|nr:hypothetical protein DOY81_013710 [Sarcophaga bullata]
MIQHLMEQAFELPLWMESLARKINCSKRECDEAEQNISIILNGIESELKFIINARDVKDELEKADAYLVVYSCVDKESFTRASKYWHVLQDLDLIRTRPIILVANKIDLARSRAVSAQDGKCLACTFGAKFIEVSVGINHNCDELLAGTLTQIRLKKEQNLLQPKTKKLKNKSKEKTKDNSNANANSNTNSNSNNDNNCVNKNYDFDQGEKSLNDKNSEVMVSNKRTNYSLSFSLSLCM